MWTWFRDDGSAMLAESAVKIAWDFLAAAGEIDDPVEANRFLTGKIEFLIGQGRRNKLVLSNRAILAFQQYKQGPRGRAIAGFAMMDARS
jgi:hypothetical protein